MIIITLQKTKNQHISYLFPVLSFRLYPHYDKYGV